MPLPQLTRLELCKIVQQAIENYTVGHSLDRPALVYGFKILTFSLSIICFSDVKLKNLLKNSTQFYIYLKEKYNLTDTEASEILNSYVDVKTVSKAYVLKV